MGVDMNQQSSWAIEYSQSQEAFHIGKTAEMLHRNIVAVNNGHEMEYICIGIFPTQELAREAMLEFRRKRIPTYTISLL